MRYDFRPVVTESSVGAIVMADGLFASYKFEKVTELSAIPELIQTVLSSKKAGCIVSG